MFCKTILLKWFYSESLFRKFGLGEVIDVLNITEYYYEVGKLSWSEQLTFSDIRFSFCYLFIKYFSNKCVY